MIRAFILSVVILGLFAGCGRIEEDIKDGLTVTQDLPITNNDIGTKVNSYGYYGSDKVLYGKKIVEGVWSVYEQSNEANINNPEFYNWYKRGYDFREDGTAFTRELPAADYIFPYQWGVNVDGSTLKLEDGNSYVYSGETFQSDPNCFKVTLQKDGSISKTVKFCNESLVDMTNENTMGYYGSDVAFGNLTDFNFKAVGVWTIGPYDSSNPASTSWVTLSPDGNTSNNGEWGVSADGKVIGIDGIHYLVYKYLYPSSDKCIAVFELSSGYITSKTWKLCKQ